MKYNILNFIDRYIYISFTIIIITILSVVSARSQDRMLIDGEAPPKQMEYLLGSGWKIYISGTIDVDADKRFADFISRKNPPYTSTIIFNSPGGSPVTAMRIGRLIRERGYSVDVGRKIGVDGAQESGICFSACSLAYLGGRFRWLSSGARYGVHRFWFDKPIENSVDVTQILSVAIATYVHEMGVSPKFNEAFVSAGKNEILEPSLVQLEAMRVINNGFEPTNWTIESREGVFYLKGERDTVHGINKFILFCGNSNVALHMIMDPQGRENEIMGMKSHRFVVNNNKYSRIEPFNRQIINGWFNATYKFSKTQARSIASAETIGVLVQHSDASPIFLGFNTMEIGLGRSKIRSFLKSCRI
jgi:hypothetical protein